MKKVLILLMIAVVSLSAKMPNDGSEIYLSILEKYNKAHSLTIDFNINYYEGKSKVAFEKIEGCKIIKSGDESFVRMDGSETINAKPYTIQLIHSEKMMVIAPYTEMPNLLQLPDLKKNITEDYAWYHTSLEGDMDMLVMSHKTNRTEVKMTKIVYNRKTFELIRTIVEIEALNDFGLEEKRPYRMEVDYKKQMFSEQKLLRKEFDHRAYFTVNKEKYVPTEKYRDYSIENLIKTPSK